MVVKSFDSGVSALLPFDPATHRLLLEWSPLHVHLVLWNQASGQLVALESFAGAATHEDAWDELANHSRLIHYRDVPLQVLNASPRALPVPQEVFDMPRAEKELDLLHGAQPFQSNVANQVTNLHMVWLHQLPEAVHQWLTANFNQVTVTHTIGTWLTLHGHSQHGAQGKVLIYDNIAWVMLFAYGNLQYAWSVPVHTADDLAYRLLNACRQLQVDAAHMHWQIGGMIEQDAPLYQGLCKYLEHVEGWPLPEVELNSQVPAHYIAHLFQLMP